MAIINIPQTGLWGSIASSLNAMFTEIFGRTGWAQYSDTQYTGGTTLTVNAGTQRSLPNNAVNVIDSQIPYDYTTFYDGSRVVAQNSGDTFTLRVTALAYGSINEASFNLKVDISAAGDGSNVVTSIPVRMIRGSGAVNAQLYTVSFDLYALNTFVQNGATVLIEAVAGNITVSNINFFIERKHKAR